MTQIILLTGKAQGGKDSSGDYLSLMCKFADKSYAKYSFAEPLKEFCINVLGLSHKQCYGSNEDKDTYTHIRWSSLPFDDITLMRLCKEAKVNISLKPYMSGRQVMQVFGSEICRRIYPDCWAENTLNRILKDDLDFAFIADVRFQNEVLKFKDHNPIVFRFTRNPINSQHQSETALDNFDFEQFSPHYYLIDNQDKDIEWKNKQLEEIFKKYL